MENLTNRQTDGTDIDSALAKAAARRAPRTRTERSQEKELPRERVPIHRQRSNTSFQNFEHLQERYALYWELDIQDRLQRRRVAGWEHVTWEEAGDLTEKNLVKREGSMGDYVCVFAKQSDERGTPDYLWLMKLPKELAEQDAADRDNEFAKQMDRMNDPVEQIGSDSALQSLQKHGQYGKSYGSVITERKIGQRSSE